MYLETGLVNTTSENSITALVQLSRIGSASAQGARRQDRGNRRRGLCIWSTRLCIWSTRKASAKVGKTSFSVLRDGKPDGNHTGMGSRQSAHNTSRRQAVSEDGDARLAAHP